MGRPPVFLSGGRRKKRRSRPQRGGGVVACRWRRVGEKVGRPLQKKRRARVADDDGGVLLSGGTKRGSEAGPRPGKRHREAPSILFFTGSPCCSFAQGALIGTPASFRLGWKRKRRGRTPGSARALACRFRRLAGNMGWTLPGKKSPGMGGKKGGDILARRRKKHTRRVCAPGSACERRRGHEKGLPRESEKAFSKAKNAA